MAEPISLNDFLNSLGRPAAPARDEALPLDHIDAILKAAVPHRVVILNGMRPTVVQCESKDAAADALEKYAQDPEATQMTLFVREGEVERKVVTFTRSITAGGTGPWRKV